MKQLKGLDDLRLSGPCRKVSKVAIVLGLALTAAACGSDSQTGEANADSDASTTTVKVGTTTTGSTTLTRLVIDQQNLDDKRGLEIEWVPLDNAAVQKAFALKQFDVNFAETPLDLIRTRASGDEAKAVSIGSLANVYITVQEDSPYQNFGDLEGEKVGLYSLTSGSTAALARLVEENYGLDLYDDFELVVSPPPTLVGLLQKGEIEAMINIDPTSLDVLNSGGVREIMDLGEEWENATGGPLLVSTMAIRDSFAVANPHVSQQLVDTFREAIEYIKSHDDVYQSTGFIKLSGLEATPDVVKQFSERFGKLYTLDWDQSVIDANQSVIEEAIAQGTIEANDDDWYSFDYVD